MKKPDRLSFIPIPIPPELPAALEFPEGARWACLTYQCTDCFIETDGFGGGSRSYWVFNALISHPAFAIHLIECDLGSDDSFPTHALLVDVESSKIYIGSYGDVGKFIKEATPPAPELTPEEYQTLVEVLDRADADFKEKMENLDIGKLVAERMENEQKAIAAITAFLDEYRKSAIALLPEIIRALKATGNEGALIQLSFVVRQLQENDAN